MAQFPKRLVETFFIRMGSGLKKARPFHVCMILIVTLVCSYGSAQAIAWHTTDTSATYTSYLPFIRNGSVTYYLDCVNGDDRNKGTSPTQAWKTLDKVNDKSFTLKRGENLLLKRGCSWTGPLLVRWSGTADQPITIGAYGSGDLPIIKNSTDKGNPNNVDISASYVVVEYLHTMAKVERRDSSCANQAIGHTVGFNISSESRYVTVRNSKAEKHTHAVRLRSGSRRSKLLYNEFINNTMMETLDKAGNNDSGAAAIVVQGDDNEIAYNRIDGHDACSYDYGRDGSAVEIYGGKRNYIHHNTAHNNNTFTELGQKGSEDNTFAYNLVTADIPKAQFVVTRGGDSNRGPVLRTNVVHNTVYLTHGESFAVNCDGTCGANILALKNNIIWSNGTIGYIDSTGAQESNNVFWHSGGKGKIRIFFPTPEDRDRTSKIADPRFVDAAKGDFRLRSDSPAIDMGVEYNAGFKTSYDLAGNLIPQGGKLDAGAYEYVAR